MATKVPGFALMRIEMLVPVDIDSSVLLERMQEITREMIEETEDEDEHDGPPLDDTAIELIVEETSVQEIRS